MHSSFAQPGYSGVYSGIVPGQETFSKGFFFGTAFSSSVINNRKEPRGVYKPGISYNIGVATKPWFSWSAEYCRFPVHNSSPSFINIHAWNTELNGCFTMHMGDSRLLFRTLFGVGYMHWQGTFIGPSLNDNNKYYYGMLLQEKWVCGNLGFGFSHPIWNNLSGFGDFRVRFASEQKDLISISDTAFLLGLHYQVNFNNRHAQDNTAKKDKLKTSDKRPGRIYKWLHK